MATGEEKNKLTPAYDTPEKFPFSDADKARRADYEYFLKLFEGAHFEAFKLRIKSEDFNKAYSKMRYIYVNYAGMLSRIVADMLFGEPVGVSADDEKTQAYLEDLWAENNLDIAFYESALTNSAQGDAVFKLRTDDKRVYIEQVPASLYFPHVDPFNIGAEPKIKELAWRFKIGKDEYLRREIHDLDPDKGLTITNEVYKLKGEKIGEKVSLDAVGLGDIDEMQETGIKRHMIIHIPNWRTSDRHFGYSDYSDLDALFFAINNRISKIDNVLDTHTDPFLMVPEGVIGEDGKVKKDGRIIEMGEGENGKPEYIVWDASLENAFKQIEKLLEFFNMVGEVSPDINGMGKGQSDSGRALKFKLMRTIAKVSRKKLYYDPGIKEILYVAQLLAKEHKLEANGTKFTGEPVRPDLVWQDGLPTDEVELIDNEVKKIDAGITSQKEAIQKVHQVDEKTAEVMLKEIEKEQKAKMPEPLDPNRNPFTKPGGSKDNPPKN